MKNYTCTILYKCDIEKKLLDLLSKALKMLGFEPKKMTVIFDEFSKSFDEIEFNKDYLFALLKKNPSTISIKNKSFDENNKDGIQGLSVKITTNERFSLETCSITWSNENLDFLIKSDQFDSFLNNEDLIYCYCYDQNDCYSQSRTGRINPNFSTSLVVAGTTKEFMLHDIDISKNFGRVVNVRGMSFVAAPLMWYGEGFYKIISKEELLRFSCSTIIKYSLTDLVYIKLFELYEDPSKIENRHKQGEFWEFFNLQKKIKSYEYNNPIDVVAWLKARADTKKKRK